MQGKLWIPISSHNNFNNNNNKKEKKILKGIEKAEKNPELLDNITSEMLKAGWEVPVKWLKKVLAQNPVR